MNPKTLNPKWGFPKIRGTLFGDPYNKDYNILGSILGSPYLRKLPNSKKKKRTLNAESFKP